MTEIPYWLPIVFFLIALFYSMVGFGGGSSYVAVLILVGLHFQSVPPIALVCNLIVTVGGCWHFYKGGHFKLKTVLPFLALSMPMAYLAGRLPIAKELFCLLLGFSLLAVALRMILPNQKFEEIREVSWRWAWLMGLPVGAALGFLAGLVGIGGGIFLSPLLLLMRWVNIKQAAASASLFIAANSFFGLMGQFQKGTADLSSLLPLAVAVFLGGQIGSRLGSYKIPRVGLQRLLATLIMYVSGRLILGVL